MKIYHKLVRADNPDVTKFISKFIPPGKGLALDVGCGEGYLSKMLKEKGYFVIGIDIDSQMLKIARKNCHKIMKVDITEGLPFKDCSFNFLLCSDVLEHIDNPFLLLKEIKRVCKKKASIVIKIPNGWFDFMFILEDHKRLFTKLSFEKLLENCKFKIIRSGEMGIIPFLRKVVSFPQSLVYVLKKMQ